MGGLAGGLQAGGLGRTQLRFAGVGGTHRDKYTSAHTITLARAVHTHPCSPRLLRLWQGHNVTSAHTGSRKALRANTCTQAHVHHAHAPTLTTPAIRWILGQGRGRGPHWQPEGAGRAPGAIHPACVQSRAQGALGVVGAVAPWQLGPPSLHATHINTRTKTIHALSLSLLYSRTNAHHIHAQPTFTCAGAGRAQDAGQQLLRIPAPLAACGGCCSYGVSLITISLTV